MSAPSPLRLASVAILCAIPWLLALVPAGAATLHVVIATDIGANDIGGDMLFDASELAQLVAANVPRDQVQIVLVGQGPGERVDRNAILRAIYGLKVQPEDTVFFYHGGHGAFNTNTDAYGRPYGTYAVFSGSASILYQSEIRGAIARMRPRLSVVALDCCNSLRPIPTPPLAPAKQVPVPPTVVSPLFDELFFKPSGTLVLESSKPGEYAFVKPTLVGPGGTKLYQGSLFAGSFRGVLANSNDRFGWNDVIGRTQRFVTDGFRNLVRSGQMSLQGAGEPVNQTDQTLTPVVFALR